MRNGKLPLVKLDGGHAYEGEWLNSKFHGRGIYTWASGDRYEGEYRDHKCHGRGIQTYADGNRYEGDYSDNQYHGRGIYNWVDGGRYEGDYRDNKKQGRGILTQADGGRYEGDYRDDKILGQGIYTWANGNRYDGQWHDHYMRGRGVFTSVQGGWTYSGVLEQSRPTEGELVEADGRRFKVTYAKDCALIKENPEPKTKKEMVAAAPSAGAREGGGAATEIQRQRERQRQRDQQRQQELQEREQQQQRQREEQLRQRAQQQRQREEQLQREQQQQRQELERQQRQREELERQQRQQELERQQRQRGELERQQRQREELELQQRQREELERQQRQHREEHRLRQEQERQEREQQQQHQREEERQQRREQERQRRLREQEMQDLLGRGSPCKISVDLVVIITDNFSDEKKLGEGAFGDVYEGVVKDTENLRQVRVAVKRLKPSIRLQGDETEQGAALTSIRREIHVLGRFYHPNIIRLLGFTSTSAGTVQELCLVYELGQHGSLDKMLVDSGQAPQDLSCKVRVRIAAGVSRALNYLHCHDPRGPAFHRDVKSANIVLDLGFSPKLIDCGLSKFISEQNPLGTIMSTHGAALGTPGYMCPAYQRTLKFEAKSEIYSFGMVLLELMTGRIQGYQGLDKNDLFAEYIDDERSVLSDLDTRAGTWSSTCAEQVEALARECLAPHRRRIGTMLAVMRRLVDLEKQFCLATDEERRMLRLAEDLHNELDALRHKGVLAEQLERKLREQAAELTALREREREVQSRREREDNDRADRLRRCFVCFDEVDVDAGVECRTGHFMCGAVCLNEEVKTQVSMENIGAFKNANLRIKCRHPECSGDSWLDIAKLTRHLAEDGFRAYLGAREAVQVGEALKEQEERYNKKVRELEEQMQKVAAGKDRAVLQARKKIIEDILTLKCPRQHCRQAFVDFEGCFALTCGTCTCGFCAYCLQDCDRDTHRHVANCQYNIAPGKDVFASVQVFERAQRERRTRLLKEHLAHHVKAGLRGALIEAMERDLADLGIDGAQLLTGLVGP